MINIYRSYLNNLIIYDRSLDEEVEVGFTKTRTWAIYRPVSIIVVLIYCCLILHPIRDAL